MELIRIAAPLVGSRPPRLVSAEVSWEEIEDQVKELLFNEQTRPAGQIALANFRNPEGLSPAGDNTWAATDASGQELVGAPGTGLLGGIQSGAIETSNVDMAKELGRSRSKPKEDFLCLQPLREFLLLKMKLRSVS